MLRPQTLTWGNFVWKQDAALQKAMLFSDAEISPVARAAAGWKLVGSLISTKAKTKPGCAKLLKERFSILYRGLSEPIK